ncbi:hypothetical protein EG329_006025 [Mollisiaceae sp. DMI_Dod_QoI]|nr:hypothetical protein EG329_006025 [Helotiales sp. DMI_Dod_QoI]
MRFKGDEKLTFIYFAMDEIELSDPPWTFLWKLANVKLESGREWETLVGRKRRQDGQERRDRVASNSRDGDNGPKSAPLAGVAVHQSCAAPTTGARVGAANDVAGGLRWRGSSRQHWSGGTSLPVKSRSIPMRVRLAASSASAPATCDNLRCMGKGRQRRLTVQDSVQQGARCKNGLPASVLQFAEPIALTSVFPYLPEMIESFGVERENVARWAGIAGASFSFAQCLTAIMWGRASDRFGRKPTILFALFCTMIACLVWGMARTLPMAIAARALAGGCNGNVGIIRTMVAEMVPQKELQPRAFSIMPLVWTIGSIFGPSFGGMFAKPTENLPWLFGNSQFFAKFPFLLPNLVAAALFILGLLTGVLFLEETLETKKHQTDYGVVLGKKLINSVKTICRLHPQPKPFRRASESFDESAASLLRPTSSVGSDLNKFDEESFNPKKAKPPQPRPTMKEVFTRQSVINLVAYTFLALQSVAYDQLLPIFLHMPPQVPNHHNTKLPFKFSGGFGLGSSRIGTLFTMYGVVGCFIQFLIFPPTARKFGVLNCFKVCAVTFPLIAFITPYTALIQNSTTQQVAMFGIMIVKSFAVIFAFPCSIILLTNSVTSLRILGTLNGFAVSISAVGKGIGPAMGGAVFSFGLEKGYMITAWWLIGIIAAIGAIPIWFLVEMPGFSKSDSDSEDDEDLLPTVEEDMEGEVRETRILEGDEVADENEEALDTVDGPPLSLVKSRKSFDGPPSSLTKSRKSFDGEGLEARRPRRGSVQLERRMSSPIGVRGGSVGPGGARRLSNGLAASNMGQGTGGTSFA